MLPHYHKYASIDQGADTLPTMFLLLYKAATGEAVTDHNFYILSRDKLEHTHTCQPWDLKIRYISAQKKWSFRDCVSGIGELCCDIEDASQ